MPETRDMDMDMDMDMDDKLSNFNYLLRAHVRDVNSCAARSATLLSRNATTMTRTQHPWVLAVAIPGVLRSRSTATSARDGRATIARPREPAAVAAVDGSPQAP